MAQEQDKTADSGSGTAVAEPKEKAKPVPKRPPPQMLPPWKVLLHNDNKNSMEFVVVAITQLTPLNEQRAVVCMLEAHKSGVALLLTTHRERAELYQDQFQTKGLTVTTEPAE